MSAPTSDEELSEEAKEELDRRAAEALKGENTVSFEEYRRDDE